MEITTEYLQKIRDDREDELYGELEKKILNYLKDKASLAYTSCTFNDCAFTSWKFNGPYPTKLYERFAEEHKAALNITRRRFLGFALNSWEVKW